MWNLPCYEKAHFRVENHFLTQIWFIQEAAMVNGNSRYDAQNKESEGHRFYYNEDNISGAIIILTKDFAEATLKVTQRQMNHCLMLKVYTKNEVMLLGHCQMQTSWMSMKALVDELEATDKMLEELAAGSGRNPMAIFIGGDWNASMTESATESHGCEDHMGERAEIVAYFMDKWGISRASTAMPREDAWCSMTRAGAKKECVHMLTNMQLEFIPPLKLGPRSDHRPKTYMREATTTTVMKFQPQKLHKMFGCRPTVAAAHRLARALACWAQQNIQDVQVELDRAAEV